MSHMFPNTLEAGGGIKISLFLKILGVVPTTMSLGDAIQTGARESISALSKSHFCDLKSLQVIQIRHKSSHVTRKVLQVTSQVIDLASQVISSLKSSHCAILGI